MKTLRSLAVMGIACASACGPADPEMPRMTAEERAQLERLTAWSGGSTFEDVQRQLPSLEQAEQPFPIPLTIGESTVTLFGRELDGTFQFSDDGLVKVGYTVYELDEADARALFERTRSGLRELYGDYEEESSEDPPLIGRQATWTLGDRSVAVARLQVPDEGWTVLCFVIYGSGEIPGPEPRAQGQRVPCEGPAVQSPHPDRARIG